MITDAKHSGRMALDTIDMLMEHQMYIRANECLENIKETIQPGEYTDYKAEIQKRRKEV